METLVDLSYAELQENSGVCKKKGAFLWNFVVNSGHKNSATTYRLSERNINLSRVRWTLRACCDKLDHSPVNQVDNTCYGRLLLHHSDRYILSTARFRYSGPSAIADTCYNLLASLSPQRSTISLSWTIKAANSTRTMLIIVLFIIA